MRSAREKSHNVPWPRTHWNIAGSSCYDPSPHTHTRPFAIRGSELGKIAHSEINFCVSFIFFITEKGQRSLNFDPILCHLSQPLLRFMKLLSRKHQCWTHPQAELCHTLQNSKAVHITSPLSALKKGFCYLSPDQCHHWSNQNSK